MLNDTIRTQNTAITKKKEKTLFKNMTQAHQQKNAGAGGGVRVQGAEGRECED